MAKARQKLYQLEQPNPITFPPSSRSRLTNLILYASFVRATLSTVVYNISDPSRLSRNHERIPYLIGRASDCIKGDGIALSNPPYPSQHLDNAIMTVEVALETPLANALTAAVQPKLVEVGWASEEDGSALAEYIILMLVNGKTQDQIAAELSGELLSLPPDDPSSHNFARWLFEQIENLNAQMNGQAAEPVDAPQPEAIGGEMDTDMGAGDITDVNVYVFPINDVKLLC